MQNPTKKKKRNKRKKRGGNNLIRDVPQIFQSESRLVMVEEIKGEGSGSGSNLNRSNEEEESFVIAEGSHSSAIIYRCMDKYCNDSQDVLSSEEKMAFEIEMDHSHRTVRKSKVISQTML